MTLLNDHDCLLCPTCRDEWLHHRGVRTFDRFEDGATGTEIHISGGTVTRIDSDSALRNNPSLRRGGIIIDFECERCGDGLELTISQHKGQTILAWRVSADHAARAYLPDDVSQ